MKNHNICFLGQTGFGKSSLINAVFGAKLNTNPLVSCTKELYSVSILSNDDKLITVFDTPGIGEFSSNSRYQAYYNYAVSKSDHIVLVVSLDRTDSTSQDLLDSIKPFVKSSDVRFTIAINRIDSKGVGMNMEYDAWDKEQDAPNTDCLERVAKRIQNIHENFDGLFLPYEIVPVCALRNYGIDELRNRIIK